MSESSAPETPLPPTPCSLHSLSILNSPPENSATVVEVVTRPRSARKKLRQRLWVIASFAAHVLLRLVCSSATAGVIEEVVEEVVWDGYRVSYV